VTGKKARRKVGRALLAALRDEHAELLVERPPGFVYPAPFVPSGGAIKGLWLCPKCGRRLKAVNGPKHVGAEECAFSIEVRARRNNGWDVLPLTWLRLCVDADVPLWLGPAYQESTMTTEEPPLQPVPLPHWHDRTLEGVWVQPWVTWLLHVGRDASRRDRLDALRQLALQPDQHEAFGVAFALGGWVALMDCANGDG